MLENSQVTPDKCIHVAIGVIRGLDNQILLARRPRDKHMGGLWEFPGGKIEEGESTEKALIRELEEELGITPVTFEPLISISHRYPEKTVILHVCYVLAFSGEPEGHERQEIKWIKPAELDFYSFPPANHAIISAICLPDKYALTGDFTTLEDLLAKVTRQLEQGIRLIQFRANNLAEEPYLEYAKELTSLCHQFNAKLLVKGSHELLKANWCDGVHLRAKEAVKLNQENWVYRRNCRKKWLAISCHNLNEIKVAEAIGAHFVTLSPVCLTPTHPETVPLGFSLAAKITEAASIPVFWLGGMHLKSLERIKAKEGHGIASITALWPES